MIIIIADLQPMDSLCNAGMYTFSNGHYRFAFPMPVREMVSSHNLSNIINILI
jgi:hypothetical protein